METKQMTEQDKIDFGITKENLHHFIENNKVKVEAILENLRWKDKEDRYKVLIEALVSKAESLMQRTRALDQRLLGKVTEVELGEITRMEIVIQNVKKELEGGKN